MGDPDIAEHAAEPVQQVVPVIQAHVEQQILSIAQPTHGCPQVALGHELLELNLLQVALQLAQWLAGRVERCDDRRCDRASTRAGDPLEPVSGLIKGQDRARQAYALDPTTFQDEVGWLSSTCSRGRTFSRGRRSLIGHCSSIRHWRSVPACLPFDGVRPVPYFSSIIAVTIVRASGYFSDGIQVASLTPCMPNVFSAPLTAWTQATDRIGRSTGNGPRRRAADRQPAG